MGARAHGNPDTIIIHLPIGCRRASVSSRVPAAAESSNSSSSRRCTSTSVVRWRTSVPHTHTHTRRHERCPWCRRRRVSSSSNGGGTGQERHTGNTIHRGGSRVVAHHRAYQYGTRYIGRSHARTNTHALTLSRAATAARARSRTRTHRRSGARAPTSWTRTRERARPRALRYPTAHVRRLPPPRRRRVSRIFMYNVADGRGGGGGGRPIAGRPGTDDGVGVSTARRGTERFPESVTFGRKRRAPRRRINLFPDRHRNNNLYYYVNVLISLSSQPQPNM